MKKLISLSAILGIIAIMVSCHKTTPTPTGTVYLDLPASPYQYFSNNFGDPALNQKATLGRVLFYDGHLSVNNVISCASCHKQQAAFADNVAFSDGFEGRKTGRNSKGIQNLAGSSFTMSNPLLEIHFSEQPLFWDGRENVLFNLVNRPITNHVEMGITDPGTLPAKLAKLSIYPSLFTNAYGDDVITSDRISECISLFMASIKTGHSKFEQYLAASGQNDAIFSPLELQGKNLFINKYNCENCHHIFNNFYSTADFKDIGLDAQAKDLGFGNISNYSSDRGKFRVPSLENVALTAPYMHDGRYKTLDDVIEHYSHNIQNSENLDTLLKDPFNQPITMNISADEKVALIAFLNTLTDITVVTDPKLSNPFKTK